MVYSILSCLLPVLLLTALLLTALLLSVVIVPQSKSESESETNLAPIDDLLCHKQSASNCV